MSGIKFSFEGSHFDLKPSMAARLLKQDKFCRDYAFSTKGFCTCPDPSVDFCTRFSELLQEKLFEHEPMEEALREEFPIEVDDL